MSRKRILQKGYTVTVNSYENDGDYDSEMSATYQSRNQDVCIAKMLNSLFASCHSSKESIGNMTGVSIAHSIIYKYLVDNPEILEYYSLSFNGEAHSVHCFEDEIISSIPSANCDNYKDHFHAYILLDMHSDNPNPEFGRWLNYIIDIGSELMGSSEDYVSRVCDSVSITYSDKPIYATTIDYWCLVDI